MEYFALYDDAGNIQRVAKTDKPAEKQAFLDAGFVAIEKSVYEENEPVLGRTLPSALAGLATALALLNALVQRRQQAQVLKNEQALRALQEDFRQVARAQATRVAAGDITPDQWYTIMTQLLKQLHIASAAAAVGGLTNLDRELLNNVERNIAAQLNYLRGFRDEMQRRVDANTPLTEAQIGARSGLYGNASTATFEETSSASLGLPRLPAYPGVQTICHSNCKCSWVITTLPGNGNWNCAWKISPVENCPTCLARARAFNPLQIRNGIIQPFNTAGIYA